MATEYIHVKDSREPCDEHGNGLCWRCKKTSSMNFECCPHCCEHPEVTFDEDYHDGIYATCKVCGWNQFDKSDIANNYEGIKKHA